jgi:hypothetical protein
MRLTLLSTLLASFAVAACDDSSSPSGDTVADTTPDTTPGDTTPDTTPEDTTPDTTPEDTTPGDTAPDTTPDDTTPDDTTPGDTTPDTTPDDTTPDDTTPDTTPDDTTPDDTTPDTTPDDTTPDTTPTNRAPTFTEGPAGDTDFGLPGDTVMLSVTATDADGDPLTYTWTQVSPASPVGTFSATNAANVDYRLPELGTATTITLRVSVSDGVNPAVTGTVQIATAVPRFASDIQPIFTICSGCHGGSGGMSLATANAYSNLVNVRGNNASCNTLDRVEPGQPDNSLLVRKISGTTCGGRMPASDPTFFADEPGLITRIRSWILAGALNN